MVCSCVIPSKYILLSANNILLIWNCGSGPLADRFPELSASDLNMKTNLMMEWQNNYWTRVPPKYRDLSVSCRSIICLQIILWFCVIARNTLILSASFCACPLRYLRDSMVGPKLKSFTRHISNLVSPDLVDSFRALIKCSCLVQPRSLLDIILQPLSAIILSINSIVIPFLYNINLVLTVCSVSYFCVCSDLNFYYNCNIFIKLAGNESVMLGSWTVLIGLHAWDGQHVPWRSNTSQFTVEFR